MPRKALTDRQVKQAKTPCVLLDGKGLRLRVTANAKTKSLRKSWVLRVTVKGGPVREIGLGSADTLPLADARKKAGQMLELAREGIDPLFHRDTQRAAKAAEAARAMTFKECGAAYIAAHGPSWKNPKHRQQWNNTLETYVYPVFGEVGVARVDQAMVMRVLDPIWKSKTETASRLRGRIEAILDWAAVRGLRTGENPARWRGHLQKALPRRSRSQRIIHRPALPYSELPAFMAKLREVEGISARALEFCILTANRTSEALNARWSEIDLAKAVRVIPADLMKAGREHRVPLSPRAVALLRRLLPLRGKGDWVFPGAKTGRPISNMALLMTLRRMGLDGKQAVTHGFRSTFNDWVVEQTAYPQLVADMALAHVVGNKVEAAYRRGDLFEKRRKLMNAWAEYCGSGAAVSGKVVRLAK